MAQVVADIMTRFTRFIAMFMAIAFIALCFSATVGCAEGTEDSKGLQIVVTFPNLKEDISLIACNDSVTSIAPAGVEPHSYQLTPENVKALKNADLIISTAHAPFEVRIREMVERGETNAKLVEIPTIPGIKILKNPSTGQPNLHMPIYDPENYKTFIMYVADVLSKLNAKNVVEYKANAEKVVKEVDGVVGHARKLNVVAAADIPSAQYAVSWLNVTVRYLVVKEPSLPATPEELRSMERAMKNREIQLAVITRSNSKAASMLEELAKENGIPILYVESPVSMKSVPEKLKSVAEEAERVERVEAKSPGYGLLLAIVGLFVALKGLRR